ncbi:MAG: TonB-dependent receptor, partial [Bacteroidales bacterium]
TPNHYGFWAIDWDFSKRFCLAATGNYSGPMWVPYFGPMNPEGELRRSESFFDFGAKLSYTVKLNGASAEVSGGVKNLFNNYQSDFDRGIERDPAYMYGPVSPRTLYVSVKIGNLLK